MLDQDHIRGRRLLPEVSRLQHFQKIVSPATFRPTECLIALRRIFRVRLGI